MRHKTIYMTEEGELSPEYRKLLKDRIHQALGVTPPTIKRAQWELLYWSIGIMLATACPVLNFDRFQRYDPVYGGLLILWCYFWAVFYSVKLYQTYLKMSHTKEELKAFQQVAWGHPNSDQPVSKLIAGVQNVTKEQLEDIRANSQILNAPTSSQFVASEPVEVKNPVFDTIPISADQDFTPPLLTAFDIIALENKRWEWSRKTFPNDTSLTLLRKLEEEIYEVRQDIYNDVRNPEEYADMIMCVFDSARRQKDSISPEEILTALAGKIAICKTRKWKQNNDGTYSHIK